MSKLSILLKCIYYKSKTVLKCYSNAGSSKVKTVCEKFRGYTCRYILNTCLFVHLVKSFPCVGRYREPLDAEIATVFSRLWISCMQIWFLRVCGVMMWSAALSDKAGWKIYEQTHPSACVWAIKICKKLSSFPWLPFLLGTIWGGYPHPVKLWQSLIYSFSRGSRSWIYSFDGEDPKCFPIMTQVGCLDRSTSFLPSLGYEIASHILLHLGGSHYGFLYSQWLSTNICYRRNWDP